MINRALSLTAVIAMAPAALCGEEAPKFKLPTQFSAQLRSNAPNVPEQQQSSTLYMSRDRLRIETKVMGHRTVSILHRGKGLIYSQLPGQKKFAKLSLESDYATVAFFPNCEWEFFGTETIDGTAYEKYQTQGLFMGKNVATALWVDRDSRVPFKHKFQGITFEWINFQTDPLDESLFETLNP